jgi:GxxExxY protein
MKDINQITYEIIGCAYKVHGTLGPGLLESTYEVCLAYELEKAGHRVETQKALPVVYDDIKLEAGYRVDIVVDDLVVLELKSVEAFNDVHTAQILTYLKLSCKKIGLLINFNVKDLKTGIKRYIM